MARGEPGLAIYTPEVQPEDLPRKMVPEMRGPQDQTGQAVQGLAGALQQKYVADSTTFAQNALADFRLNAINQLEEAKRNAPPGDQSGFTDKYLQQFDAQAATLQKTAGMNPYANRMIQDGLGNLRRAVTEHAVGWSAAQNTSYRVNSLSDSVTKQLAIVQAHPELGDQVGRTAMDALNTSGLQPSERLPIARNIDKQISGAIAQGMIDRDPAHVWRELQKQTPEDPYLARITDPGQRDAIAKAASGAWAKQLGAGVASALKAGGPSAGTQAFNAIDSTDAPDEVKQQAIMEAHKARAGLIEENQVTHGDDLRSLHEQLSSGNIQPDFDAKLDRLYQAVAIGPDQAGSMAGEAARIREKQDGITDTLARGQDMWDQKTVGDPHRKIDKDAAENWFQNQVDTQGFKPLSPEYNNLAAEFTRRAGVVPEPASSMARSILISSQNPDAIAAAAALVSRLRDASPLAFEYSDDDKRLQHIADSFLSLTKGAGMDPAQALEVVRANDHLSPAERQLLDDKWKMARPFGPSLSGVETALRQQLATGANLDLMADTKFLGFWPGKGQVDTLPTEMVASYDKAVRAIWEHNGQNIASAEKDAAAELSRAWGITTMNGKPEIVHFPPERMWRDIKDDEGRPLITPDLIRADIARAVAPPAAAAATAPAATPGELPKPPAADLLEEPTLENPLGRPPVKDEDGKVSGLHAFSFEDPDDKAHGEVLIPQVVDGKLLTRMEAIEHYDQTGEHLGVFKSPEAADKYAAALDAADRGGAPAPAKGNTFTRYDVAKGEFVPFVPDPEKVKLAPIPDTEPSGGRRWGMFYDEHDDGHLEELRHPGGAPMVYELPLTKEAYNATVAPLAAKQAEEDAQRLKLAQAREAQNAAQAEQLKSALDTLKRDSWRFH